MALENAVSVASVLLLTEATMTEIPEPKKGRRGDGSRNVRLAHCAHARDYFYDP